MNRKNYKFNLFSLVFLFIIFFFFICSFIVPDKLFSYMENRKLEQKPIITKESIMDKTYMEKMEYYINDQILFRDNFIKLSTNIKLLMGQREINDVYVVDDCLIEKFKESEIDVKQLEKNKKYLNIFLDNHLNSKIGLIPTSTEIWNYKLSKYTKNVNQKELINDIYSSNNYIDIYSKLNENKEKDIYYKTDHHWTMLGAYYGYVAICENLGLQAVPLSEYNIKVIDDDFKGTIQSKINIDITSDILYRYDLNKLNVTYIRIIDDNKETISDSLYDNTKLESKEKYAVYLGGNNGLTRIYTENGVEDKGRLLIIKDSFSHSLVTLLANHYSEIVLLDLRYYILGVETFLKSEEPFDDILVLYNLKNFVNEKNLIFLNK